MYENGMGMNKVAKFARFSAKKVKKMLLDDGCKIRRPTASLSPTELSEYQRRIARDRWDGRSRVTDEELTIFRANPNEENNRRIRNRILCRVCGVFVVAVDPPAHHLVRCHPDLTLRDYQQLFPGAPLCSPRTKAQRLKGHHRHYWNHPDEMVAKARAYRERKEAALRDKLAEAERLLAQPRGGRLPEDGIAEQIHPLRKVRLKWPDIKAQLDGKKNGYREPDAYRNLYNRWLKRHQEVAAGKSDETHLSGF